MSGGTGAYTEDTGSWALYRKGGRGWGFLQLPLSPGQTDTTENITFVTWLAGVNNGVQGGHGTGKTGNLVLTFSRQGKKKHREFYFDTGKNFETQGKYFFCDTGKKLDTGKIFDCDY